VRFACKGALGALAAAVALLSLAGCGDDDGGSVSAFCDKYRELQRVPNPLAGLTEGPESLAQAKDALIEVGDATSEIVEVAPSEMEGDAEALERFYDSFLRELDEVESARDFARVGQGLLSEAEEVADSGRRLERYAADNCG
jgi:hypothetical protein